MEDIAKALGVAKGTVYLYVESKEALFDLCARYADASRPLPHVALPVPTPEPRATVRYAQKRIAETGPLPRLAAAIERKRVSDPGSELEEIVREHYDILYRNRRAIKLVDRSARDFPELAAVWFEGARDVSIELWRRYIEARTRRGTFRPLPNPAAAARIVIETIAFWAVHRHWDPHPQPLDEEAARETAVQFIVNALTKE
jgi:AcrR family transcriptional regulator